jgi:subtilisin family serine protease
VLLFWGVGFCLLTSAFGRPWVAALVTTIIFGLASLGGVIPRADWGALQDGVYGLPMALILTELSARGGGVVPLVPLAFWTRVAPVLFVDPRDAMARGIPETQHVAAYAITILAAAVIGPVLWIERRVLLKLRDRLDVPSWVRNAAALAVVVVLWGVWGTLYVFAGEPGFANDGFLIIMEEQADLSGATDIADRRARLEMVYGTLTETAERTQESVRDELDVLGVPYRAYYIVNMIRVDSHRWLVGRFRDEPGVASVIVNPNVRDYPRRIPLPYGGDTGSPEGVQSNLQAIGANSAWALGAKGEGIVVAGQDTGYDWTHPALKTHYRGWDGGRGEHDYNWHDAWDHTAEPFDDDSHGTHTMGTVLGDDGVRNRTGVAPEARWIGCRNMRRGFGNPGAYAECMEFFLAPYSHQGDPFEDGDVAMSPHVVNNSWGCPDFEGCYPDTLRPAVEALRAAGIMMVVSVGNDGPGCGTATTPPANYDAVLSVGATNEGGRIVGFSSRGPADGRIKPDVTAPGEYVRSSVPGGGYGFAPGTSMAGPHVAGLVALVWSANPLLVGDIDATEALICQTAAPRPVANACTSEDEGAGVAALIANPVCACGGTISSPNNVYGCGYIDAEAAVRTALGE